MRLRRTTLLTLLAACGGASQSAAPAVDPRVWTPHELQQLERMLVHQPLPPDPTNAWSDNADAAALGRALFYDAGLSPSGRFSCATCHDPAKHFTDGQQLGVGAGIAARHTPTVEGSQQGPWFFWDGRADSLWAQAAGPIENPVEMDSDRLHVARHVLTTYGPAYTALFGDAPTLPDTPARARPDARAAHPLAVAWAGLEPSTQADVDRVFVHAMKAIAAFERTVLPGEAPFDRYVTAVLAGDATGGGALSDEAVSGLRFFLRDGACVSCHHGPYLTDRAFHNLGLPTDKGYDPGRTVGAAQVAKSPFNCSGAYSDTTVCEELRFLNPVFDDFRSAFKTPTLRNVTATAPYMHDGSMADLDAVLDFYSELPGEPMVGHRELTLQPLHIQPHTRAGLHALFEALEAPVRPEALPLR